MKPLTFEILARDKKSKARAGIIHTPNGNIQTPYLVPVATRGSIIGVSTASLKKIGIQCLFANAYHLHFKPGDKKIRNLGGLHKFMKFSRPILTDSAGFQAFSLGWGKVHGLGKIGFFPGDRTNTVAGENYAKITEEGIWFTSTYDEKTKHFIGPKESMQIQSNLGANIIMAFDECTSPMHDEAYTKQAVERTHRWALECLKFRDPKQALYGIIQGGEFKRLRVLSSKVITSLPFDGLAIGGALGRNREEMFKIVDWIVPYLDTRPVHMLGIGRVADIFNGVERGIDTFDCVETTRVARHGNLYVSPKAGGTLENQFRITIKKDEFAKDARPIDPSCPCSTCKKYTRAQIRELYRKGQRQDIRDQKSKYKYHTLATIHNVHFIHNLMTEIRKSILKGTFTQMKKAWFN
jgi:tRNA-guanine transglycosylase